MLGLLGAEQAGPSVRTGPSVRALTETHRQLVARAAAIGKAGRDALATVRALAGLDEMLRTERLELEQKAAELEHLLGELGVHEELVRGIAAGRFTVRPSASKPYDLDAFEASAAGTLGVFPLLPLVAIVAGAVVLGMGLSTASRWMEHREFEIKSNLLQKGLDISKLRIPESDLGTKVSRVTTPLALAVGAVALYGAARLWKEGR